MCESRKDWTNVADMIKIMLCDDLKTIRDSFVQAINRQEDMQVVYAAASGSEAVEYLNHCEALPDIILMDIQMESEKAGIEATRQIHEKYPRIKILMLTIFENDDLLIEAYLAGAVDYIVKDVSWKKICDTLRSASVNENFVGTIIREKTREKLDQSRLMETSMLFFINRLSKLTNSEWRILEHLYEGKKRKEISREEVLSEETVKLHIRHILRKLGFDSTREMVAYLKEIRFWDYFKREM